MSPEWRFKIFPLHFPAASGALGIYIAIQAMAHQRRILYIYIYHLYIITYIYIIYSINIYYIYNIL